VLLVLRGRVQLTVAGDDGAAEVVGENGLGELVGEFGLLMARHDRRVGCARACDVLGASPDCAVRCRTASPLPDLQSL
jgi:CRP-like cAMP-binding protein